MRVLLVHPGPLMYSELFLRLEPLGLERVAGAARAAGHEVRMVDLQARPVRVDRVHTRLPLGLLVLLRLDLLRPGLPPGVPPAAAAELASIREPNVFLVDDIAFIKADYGHAIAQEVERRRIRKRYYLETRADVLLRNTEVFERWRRLGLTYMFLGIEALDEQGLELYRKRVSPDMNMKALECARRLGIDVAINLIVDPQWDEKRFELVRRFALSVPEIVHLTVITPYPGTEIWHAQAQKLTTRDYRLFDIQHAVLPTKLPLPRFYEELVKTQGVINRKHMGLRTAVSVLGILGRQLAHSQTNFMRMLWKFNSVYDARRQHGDHFRAVRYELPLSPPRPSGPTQRTALFVHRRPAAAGARSA